MENQALIAVINWIHLLAAVAWIGGMFANFFVYLPAVRSVLDPPVIGKLMGTVMKRFKVMIYISMGILLITGMILSFTGEETLGYSALERNRSVLILGKVILYVVMSVLAIIAFESLAPGVARLAQKGPSPKLARKQRTQIRFAVTGFILGIIVLALSAAL